MDNESNTHKPIVGASAAALAADTRETIQSLELVISQISMSLQESGDSVGDLISAMAAMAGCVRRIETEIEALQTSTDSGSVADAIQQHCKQAEAAMQKAITAFQFYDRLSQRVQHIQENLRAVAEVIQAPDQQHAALWKSLHDKVRSLYSMEQEQSMYQALLKGLSAEEPIGDSSQGKARRASSRIELF